jgi:hypothetical protein
MHSPAAAAVLLSGCGHTPFVNDTVCPGMITVTAMVTVRDSASGAPLATGATATLREGGYSETLVVTGWDGSPPSLETASMLSSQSSRPGTYTVTVQRPGYATWTKSGVAVKRTDCGIATAQLIAKLVKLGN